MTYAVLFPVNLFWCQACYISSSSPLRNVLIADVAHTGAMRRLEQGWQETRDRRLRKAHLPMGRSSRAPPAATEPAYGARAAQAVLDMRAACQAGTRLSSNRPAARSCHSTRETPKTPSLWPQLAPTESSEL